MIIFLHGSPDLSIFWRRQLEFFSERGWRCIAPDLRGFGESSVPDSIAAYSAREVVADMIELHDALGGRPTVWVGHDWGSTIVWAMAAQHAARCRAVANLTVPYFARGFGLRSCEPFIDRELYPADEFPVGQFDYWRYYREHFSQVVADFEADVAATFRVLVRAAPPLDPDKPAITALIRQQGGWFGDAHRAPDVPRDETMLSEEDFATLVASYERTGFAGSVAWYLNDDLNLGYAAEAPNFGRLSLPVLFIHATRDDVCDTARGHLADPMREDVENLTEVEIDAGHLVMLQRPDETNAALEAWLSRLS